jgi:hypothetical protein
MREAAKKFCEIQTRKIELHYTDDEKVVTSFDVANDLIGGYLIALGERSRDAGNFLKERQLR